LADQRLYNFKDLKKQDTPFEDGDTAFDDEIEMVDLSSEIESESLLSLVNL
jgi:hypothetical protein